MLLKRFEKLSKMDFFGSMEFVRTEKQIAKHGRSLYSILFVCVCIEKKLHSTHFSVKKPKPKKFKINLTDTSLECSNEIIICQEIKK